MLSTLGYMYQVMWCCQVKTGPVRQK